MSTDDNTTRRRAELGPFQDLLIRACPPDDYGLKSIPILARRLNLSSAGIYKWIAKGRIPPRQAQRVVKASKGAVRLDEFNPYIFG